MDLRRLRTFVTVAERGTVSSAAQTLRITQPALSRQLQDLRAELGVPLFEQVGRRLRLTTEGADLLPACRALLQQAADVLARAHALAHGDGGELRVGASPQAIALLFPGFLHLFATKCPLVRVKVVEAGGIDLQEKLRRGELHAALSILQGNEAEFVAHRLPLIKILVACHPRGAFGRKSTVDVRDLADVPLLLLASGFGTRTTFDAACRLAGVIPRIFMESSAPATLLALAREDHGIAIVPNTVSIPDQSLHVAPLLFQGKPLTEAFAVLWNRQRRLPAYAEVFSATLAAHMRTMPQFASAGGTSRARRG